MADRKFTKKYVFTVEGETEQWYLYWLRDQINGCAYAAYHIQIIAPVQQNPWSYAKTVSAKTTPKITHLCDRESSDREHVQKFEGVLASLSRTRKEREFPAPWATAIFPLSSGCFSIKSIVAAH